MTIYSSVETGKEKSALTAEDSSIQLMWKPINSNDALGISAALASLILLLIRKRISKYFKEKKKHLKLPNQCLLRFHRKHIYNLGYLPDVPEKNYKNKKSSVYVTMTITLLEINQLKTCYATTWSLWLLSQELNLREWISLGQHESSGHPTMFN